MKIKHNIERDGCELKGQILETIFEEGEARGDCINKYSIDSKFYISSSIGPSLSCNSLYVWGDDRDDDNYTIEEIFTSEEEAKQILEYINEFAIQDEIPKEIQLTEGNKIITDIPTIRTFKTGSNRDTSIGKNEYANYIHPLNDFNYAQYMKSKQYINGEYRRGDNRQKGMPSEELFQSLVRHMENIKLMRRGYRIFEYKIDGVVDYYATDDKDYIAPEGYEEKSMVSDLNAIRFNSEALKLNYLRGNHFEE